PVDAHAVLAETGDNGDRDRIAELSIPVIVDRDVMQRSARRIEVRPAVARPARRGLAIRSPDRSVYEHRLCNSAREDPEDRSRDARGDLDAEVVVEERVRLAARAVCSVGRERRDALEVVANLEGG